MSPGVFHIPCCTIPCLFRSEFRNAYQISYSPWVCTYLRIFSVCPCTIARKTNWFAALLYFSLCKGSIYKHQYVHIFIILSLWLTGRSVWSIKVIRFRVIATVRLFYRCLTINSQQKRYTEKGESRTNVHFFLCSFYDNISSEVLKNVFHFDKWAPVRVVIIKN